MRQRFSSSLLTFVMLSSSSSFFPSYSSLVKADVCDGFGCCNTSNYGPGDLDLTQSSKGFDAVLEGDKVYVYHCVRYFTQLRWYLLQPDDDDNYSRSRRVPFPWGREGNVSFVQGRHDNQTLVFPEVCAQDEGIYVFVASNGTHEVTGQFYLQVDCRDSGPRFATQSQPEQHVKLGSRKALHCAVTPADCKGRFYETNVFWVWKDLVTGGSSVLRNTTLDSVSLVCEGGRDFGLRCDVLIHRVESPMFKGEFICRMSDGSDVNQTVRLFQIPITDVRTWLPYVLGIAGGAVALIVMAAVVVVRYRHRVQFYCRSQTSEEPFMKDVAILHGEDHEEVVRDTLLPRVQSMDYDVLDQVTSPNKLELQDQLTAVGRCRSVILTFSAREVELDGHVDHITKHVFKTKNHSTVLFIRCQDDVAPATNAGHRGVQRQSSENAQGAQREEEEDCHSDPLQPTATEASTGNSLKKEALRAFRTLHLPPSLHPENSKVKDQGEKKAREADRFWHSLQDHLSKAASPAAAPKVRTSPAAQETRGGRNTSSTESRRLLMHNDSGERSSSSAVGDDGAFPSGHGTPDVEAGNAEEKTSPHHTSRPQTARVLSQESFPQPLPATLEHDSDDDEVFTKTPGRNQDVLRVAGEHYPQTDISSESKERYQRGAQNLPGNSNVLEFSPTERHPEPAYSLHGCAQQGVPAWGNTEPSSEPSPAREANEDLQPSTGSCYPGQTSLGTTGKVEKSDRGLGVVVLSGGEKGKLSDSSNELLESQESGYHSPSSQTDRPVFEEVAAE